MFFMLLSFKLVEGQEHRFNRKLKLHIFVQAVNRRLNNAAPWRSWMCKEVIIFFHLINSPGVEWNLNKAHVGPHKIQTFKLTSVESVCINVVLFSRPPNTQ